MTNLVIKRVNESKLTRTQLAHLVVARALASGLYGAEVIPANLPYPVVAAWEVGTKRVFIHPIRLDKLSTTVNSVVHETGHLSSGFDDGTKGHTNAMESVSNILAGLVNSGKLDELLTKVVW